VTRGGTAQSSLPAGHRLNMTHERLMREDTSGAVEGDPMRKYITIFTYSSGSWARMINSPGDRTAAVQAQA
jgi:hypothetical protein